MKSFYNLLDEEWIPVIDKQARLIKVGLREVIGRAHELKRISAEYPTMTGALLLLSIAYASSVYRLGNIDDWESLHQQGRFPKDPLSAYCRQWLNRFYLFDEKHPFFQDPNFGKREKDIKNLGPKNAPESKGMTGLLLHLASGSNATLFDHSIDDEEKEFPADESARHLVMLQAYSLGGMSAASIGKDKYFKDAPFSRGILFLCRGDNLFETIMRNMIPKEMDLLQNEREDVPSWEREDTLEEENQTPAGIKDLLTWQSRRILLIPEDNQGKPLVRKCFSAPGLGLPETFANPFYMNDHQLDGTKLKIKPMRFQMNRVVWRDSGAILDPERPKRDKAITKGFMESLKGEGVLQDELIRLTLFGMCTEPGQKKAYTYQEEEFNAQAAYIEQPPLIEQLKQELCLAEGVRRALYFGTSELASYKIRPDQDTNEALKPDPKVVGSLIEHIQQEGRFWSSLEVPFYQMLTRLPHDEEVAEIWKQTLLRTAKECLAAAAELVGDDYAGLKARAKAENRMGTEIYRLLNPEKKEK